MPRAVANLADNDLLYVGPRLGSIARIAHNRLGNHRPNIFTLPVARKQQNMAELNRETATTLDIKFDDKGLVPAIVQDHETGRILMMGWMNQAALTQTLDTKLATFYSRSRGKMWVKGESSGHTQEVLEARTDCDQDVVVLKCKSNGPCCHVGYRSCFYRKIIPGSSSGPTPGNPEPALEIVDEREFNPDVVYQS